MNNSSKRIMKKNNQRKNADLEFIFDISGQTRRDFNKF